MEELIINCEKAIELRNAKAELEANVASLDEDLIETLAAKVEELEQQAEIRRKFTPEEVEQRMAEIAAVQIVEAAQRKRQLSQELVQVIRDIADARRTAGQQQIDMDDWVAEMEARRDEILAELRP